MDLILTEQRELTEKRAELQQLEDTLAARETELAVLQSSVREFELNYLEAIGKKFDELAEIEKQIAATLGQQVTDDDYTVNTELECGQTKFHAADNLKKLYREVARLCHPDLAGNEQERAYRHKLMIAANQAYEAGAEERLQALLSAESNFAELARQSLSAVDLVQVMRAITTTQEQIVELDNEIKRVTNSELYRLKQRADRSAAIGHDFLQELVSQVERQIRKSQNRLTTLQAELTVPA
jgi:predicted  nucleic acid-binding Zn-ribbon protein